LLRHCLIWLPEVRSRKHHVARQNERVSSPDAQAGEQLRTHGLRSTPQRRAILAAFSGGRSEHLSADEVYARAAESLPGLSRGTVYATLAEFSELGLLSAFGAPEPVRYETNTTRHAHFRCRLCTRLFDLATGIQEPAAITDPGFVVERVETQAEGICANCTDYAAGLKAGARAITRTGPARDTLEAPGLAALQTESPLGPLMLAATPNGLIRVAFEGHGDFARLQAHASRRRGSRAAHQQLGQAAASLHAYFAGEPRHDDWVVDWAFLDELGGATLRSLDSIPHGDSRSYSALDSTRNAHDLGRLMGANPIPIVAPCHRVTRGVDTPTVFVGGSERRHWLENHERSTGDAP
jgi:methylated-DNA-[protein]-cysteine S-methyltransferase